MPEIRDLSAFLQGKPKVPLRMGKSGAQVFFVGDAYVLKHAERAQTPRQELWDSYVREARMYAAFRDRRADFVPDVRFIEHTPKTLSLLLARGQTLEKTAPDAALTAEIMDLLVRIHHFPAPEFLEKPRRFAPPDARTIAGWKAGWESVLDEHPGAFERQTLDLAADSYVRLNLAMDERPRRLVHGDFHFENLLRMPDGRLTACDWQSAGIGDAAGDLSFLCSRLRADGVEIDEDALIRAYCAACERAGSCADAQAIGRTMALSNLNTSFAFWHEYLHGADTARVAGIYEKMCADMRMLLSL